jgi:threonine dehydratase
VSVTIDDILAARERIQGSIYLSPCPDSVPISEVAGCHIYCKLDFLQRTGSFKERGACNALMLLSPEKKRRGVIGASAGNHALGLAYHGQRLGVPVTVVMPEFAPLVKRSTCRQLGATVVLAGQTFGEAKTVAEKLAEERGLTYVHGFNDPGAIAGQGTMGLEVIEQVPEFDAVIVPVGGGGLLAGVAVAMKHLRPGVAIYGVEPRRAASWNAAVQAGRPVPVSVEPTLADGLGVPQVGQMTFALAGPLVERVVLVSEDELALAILRIVELEKSVVEGAGAAPLAALLSGQLPELKGKRVVLLLGGGNIDPTVLSGVIEKGLVADGRLCRFTAVISDRPGGLARLAGVIASTSASIKDIEHDRAFAGGDVFSTKVVCTVETTGREHIQQLLDALKTAGIRVDGGAGVSPTDRGAGVSPAL